MKKINQIWIFGIIALVLALIVIGFVFSKYLPVPWDAGACSGGYATYIFNKYKDELVQKFIDGTQDSDSWTDVIAVRGTQKADWHDRWINLQFDVQYQTSGGEIITQRLHFNGKRTWFDTYKWSGAIIEEKDYCVNDTANTSNNIQVPENSPEALPEEEITHPHIEVDPTKALLGVDYAAHPPHSIMFRNREELTAFIESPNLSPEEFDVYADENNYSMNRVRTPEDAQVIVDFIQSFQYLNIPGTEWYFAQITFYNSGYFLNYGMPDGDTFRKQFAVNMRKLFPDENPAADNSDLTPVILADDTGKAFFIGNTQNGAGEIISRYLIVTEDTEYIIMAWNTTEEDFRTVIESITFTDAGNFIYGNE